MPAYSFKERFVPFVLNGSKPHTIRSIRKNRAKKGDTLYLYFGLRTKYVRKLREEGCSNAVSICINENLGIILYDHLLDKHEEEMAKINPTDSRLGKSKILTAIERDHLAWCDGFRPEGSSGSQPYGSYNLMLRFWRQTHELPFVGDIIYWQPNPSI